MNIKKIQSANTAGSHQALQLICAILLLYVAYYFLEYTCRNISLVTVMHSRHDLQHDVGRVILAQLSLLAPQTFHAPPFQPIENQVHRIPRRRPVDLQYGTVQYNDK